MEFPLRVSDGLEGFAFNNPINDGFFTEKSDCRTFAAGGNGFQFGLSDAYGLLGKQRNQCTSNSFWFHDISVFSFKLNSNDLYL
jgi:hypothetical protein